MGHRRLCLFYRPNGTNAMTASDLERLIEAETDSIEDALIGEGDPL